jgi:hypothetical protein
MKINEIISEAHHSIYQSIGIGHWIVDIDTHFIVTLTDRSDVLNPKEVFNIITHACLSEELQKIPRGTGAFVQDVVSKISVYLYRYKNKPNRLRLETVLTPDMIPKDPIIHIYVIPDDYTISARDVKRMDRARSTVRSMGRDAISQDLEQDKNIMHTMSQMSRNERRAFKKFLQRTK